MTNYLCNVNNCKNEALPQDTICPHHFGVMAEDLLQAEMGDYQEFLDSKKKKYSVHENVFYVNFSK